MTIASEIREALEWATIFDRRDNTGHVVGRAMATSRTIREAARAYADLLEKGEKYPLLYYCKTHAAAHLGGCGYEVEQVMVVRMEGVSP